MPTTMSRTVLLASAALFAAACGGAPEAEVKTAAATPSGSVYVVSDTTIDATLEAAGIAEPLMQSTLSTKLMGTVTEVLVREGDRVSQGQALVRIDARELDARAAQVAASVAEAEAVQRDAAVQVGRIRTLYADSAATKAQLDAAETGLARAEAAVRAANAASSELQAMSGYAVIRAPFAGIVTQRLVDAGAFAAPGTPLLVVQNSASLRITASAPPSAVASVRRGTRLSATIEGAATVATVEGVVPSAAGSVYTVNAIVENARAQWLPGSAATLQLPQGRRTALVVPTRALRREGDLVGVLVREEGGDVLRWIRLGVTVGEMTEVLGGLRPGDRVVVPDAVVSSARE